MSSLALPTALFWGIIIFALLTLQLLLIPGFNGTPQFGYGVIAAIAVVLVTVRSVRDGLGPDRPWSEWRSLWIRTGCVAGIVGASAGALVYALDMASQSYASGFRYSDGAYGPLSVLFLWIVGSFATCPVGAVQGLAVAVVSLPFLQAVQESVR